MRSAIAGSGLVHLVLLIVLLAVRAGTPIVVPGPDVVQVSFVDAGAVANPPPPAPQPKPLPEEAPEIAPTEETGVKLAPPPKKKPEKKPEPVKPEPPQNTPVAALPYESVGNVGLRGQVAVDAVDFEFTYYLLLVRNRIAGNWSPPAGMMRGGQPVRAVVYFRIHRGGNLSDARIETSSSAEYFDRSALRAVMLSDPMPPLPLGYSGGDLGVHFGFEFQAP